MKDNRFAYNSLKGINKEEKSNKEQNKNIDDLADKYISTVFGDEFLNDDKDDSIEDIPYLTEPPKGIRYEVEKQRNSKKEKP